MCDRQSSSKYSSRPSPPYPANKCRGMKLVGNDGRLYVSIPDKNNVAKWKLVEEKRKSVKKSVKSRRRKTVKDVAKENKKKSLKRSSSCKKSPTNKREDLIKELRCHVKYWEKVTQKNQDMSMERLREEPLSFIKKMLKWYRTNNPDPSYF